MKKINEAVKDLEEIVSKNVDKYKFPEIKRNSIRIGRTLIRAKKDHGYVIVDIEKNKTIEVTYSKSGAIAFALAYQKKKNIKHILYYDSVIEKNANDSQFYSYIIQNSKDETKVESTLTRFEESRYKISWAKSALDDYILKDIR
jgi:hypothetical protein